MIYLTRRENKTTVKNAISYHAAEKNKAINTAMSDFTLHRNAVDPSEDGQDQAQHMNRHTAYRHHPPLHSLNELSHRSGPSVHVRCLHGHSAPATLHSEKTSETPNSSAAIYTASTHRQYDPSSTINVFVLVKRDREKHFPIHWY